MQDDKLREALEGLRAEINSADLSAGPARERLNKLISDLERKLEVPDDEEHHESFLGNIKESISQLEVEYPQATAILNQIMTSLGGTGI